MNFNNFEHGSKVLGYTLGALTQCLAISMALAASTFWGGVAMYIAGLIIGLIAMLIVTVGMVTYAPGALESIGAGAFTVANKVSGWFTKSPVAVAA